MAAIQGTWVRAGIGAKAGLAHAFVAGRVHGQTADGERLMGDATEFVAEDGRTGPELLAALVVAPSERDLFRGCVRESLVAAHLWSEIGRQDTRDWERAGVYVVGESGSDAYLSFDSTACVGVFSLRSRPRELVLPGTIPPGIRERLERVRSLPLFTRGHTPTAVLWSEDGRVRAPEPWPIAYLFGAELLRRELLAMDDWHAEVEEDGEIPPDVAALASTISNLAAAPGLPSLTSEERATIVRPSAPYAATGLESLKWFPTR
jgi:hypothetical protein